MELNKETIKHYRAAMIPLEELKKIVMLNAKDLTEKPNWYNIEGYVQYFKPRNDVRIFTELFFEQFASRIMGLKTLEHRLICMRTIDPVVKKNNEVISFGLLSKNFQDKNYNHYLASELMSSEISDYVSFASDYSLTGLLNYFQENLVSCEFEKVKNYLITLFIADGFTFQLDRNPHNISFRIPKIPGVSYKERLRAEHLRRIPEAQEYIAYEDGKAKLKGLFPTCVYDSERCLCLGNKKPTQYNNQDYWFPSLPYDASTLYPNAIAAGEYSEEYCEGLDPNLLALYWSYPDICTPLFERLAYDDEYRKILEEFASKPAPIVLARKEIESLEDFLGSRQQVMKRILTL